MSEPNSAPIIGAIQVLDARLWGVMAIVDGQRRIFPNLEAVFGAALRLLDDEEHKSPPLERKQP